MQRLSAAARWIDRFIAGLTAALIFVALGIFLYGMVVRFAMPSLSAGWIEEVTVYLVVWATLLAAVGVVAEKEHVRMDALLHLFPKKAKQILTATGGIVAFVYCVGMAWSGWLTVDFSIAVDERGPSEVRIPMAWYYACFPVGMAFCAIRTILQTMQKKFSGESQIDSSS